MKPTITAVAALLAGVTGVSSARAASETIGVWTVTSEPSSTGGGMVTALAPSPAASLNDPNHIAVRCLGGRTELMIGGAGQWPYTRKRMLDVTVQLDGGTPQTTAWNVSTNGKAVFFDGRADDFLKTLPDAGKLRVVVTDASGAAHENIFATTGIVAVRAKIADACGWAR